MRLDRIKIRMLLMQKDMRQNDLVELSGVGRNTISAVLNGKGCTSETAQRIAAGLRVELNDILEKEAGNETDSN